MIELNLKKKKKKKLIKKKKKDATGRNGLEGHNNSCLKQIEH